MRSRIGEYLIRSGLITQRDLEDALAERARTGERLGSVLVRRRLVSERQVAEALALQLGFPFVDLAADRPDPAAIALIPRDAALEHVCVATSVDKSVLTVAMADPLVFTVVHDLELQTGYRIRQAIATHTDIVAAIEAGYADDAAEPEAAREITITEEESSPAIELLDRILTTAVESGASDVHIEPTGSTVLVRHRLDGVLSRMMEVPRQVHEELVARLKLMAGMDVTERLLPQDGRIRADAAGTAVDFRAATLRTLFGEKVILRALDRPKTTPGLDELGMSAVALDELRRLLGRSRGLVLFAGPPGSGKTTTASAAVMSLRSENASIATIEDPIEYSIPGVTQTQIDHKLGLTFAGSVRAVLSHGPDALLIGEIRDADTARIAIEAGQGRLVLATIVEDDAASCVARLARYGIEPMDVASALSGVVAQRLVRQLCVHCRRPHTPPPDVLRALGLAEDDAAATGLFTATGCDHCNHTGYRGRTGIFEVLRIGEKLNPLVAARAPTEEIRAAALSTGLVTLAEDGLAKAKSGVTTAEELLRTIAELREPRTLCAECGTAVGVDFSACPHCGARLAVACAHCGRALQPGWNFCPYCARGADVARPPKRRIMRAVTGTKARRGSSESETQRSKDTER